MSTGESQFNYNDRYGIKPANSWRRYGIALLALGLAWIAWAGIHHANPALSSELISFENSDPRNPTIRFTVDRRDASAEVSCTLVARDIDKNIVGQIDELIKAGEKHLDLTVTVPTRADAVNVGIAQCRLLNL